MKRKKSKCVSYAKWGYIFLIPFFLVYIIFQLIPLLSTFYNSFFENYRVGLMQVGPTFVGFKNYKEILSQLQDFLCGDDIKYIYTMRMNGDRLEFIVDADTEEGAAIGEEYEIYDEIAEAFDGNATVDSEMTSDEWGDFYSAFAPVYNSSGEIAGIVGVDCSATDIRLQENIFIKEFVIIELAGLVIAAALSLIISGVLSRNVSVIAEKMSELAKKEGDLTQKINVRSVM